MKYIAILAIGVVGVACGQSLPPAGKTSGPGVQSTADSREADLWKTCKVPPAPRGGGGGGQGKGQGKGAPPPVFPRDYKVTEIPGVIAAGQMWKEVWTVEGNNADGIIGTKDGGLLIAQNDNSNVVKLDKDGKISNAYTGTNTGGSVAMNAKGALFIANRGYNPSIEQLAPTRKTLANKYNGEPMDCIGVVLNDMAADSKGGVYFTMGGLYHADAKGNITKYGEMLTTNGIMLSADEKHLWVTNGPSLAEFDVQKDGSLTNQHEFVNLQGGGDGSTFDSMGRLYVTTNAGVEVISPEGKSLGVIPTPRAIISVAFSGPDKKMLYVVARTGNTDWILGISTIAQGAKGRGK